MHIPKLKQNISYVLLSALAIAICSIIGFSAIAGATTIPPGCPGDPTGGTPAAGTVCPDPVLTSSPSGSAHYCGQKDKGGIQTSIDIGCSGTGDPIPDLVFALIRLLSDGVGIVVIASIIVAGIQFTTSRGDPQASAKAIGRVRSSVVALAIYIFAYAILNYVIPVGFFNR